MAVRMGVALTCFGILGIIGLAFAKLFLLNFQAGWLSIISVITIATGLQIFFIGLAAMYLGRVYKETKQRPLYSVKETTNID
jgi:dolichol-phosphate mannosyltransferase